MKRGSRVLAAKKNGKTVQLTNEFLQKVSKPGIYTDGPGRYGLDCKVSLSNKCADPNRYFRQKTTFLKKRITVGIGAYPGLSLQDARDIAHDNWKKARAGIDPRKVKQVIQDKSGLTFNEVAEMVIVERSKIWKDGSSSERSWRGHLRREVYPIIGHLPVGQVTEDQLYELIVPLSIAKYPTAVFVLSIVKLIFEWCEDKKHRADTPVTDRVRRQLSKVSHDPKHFRHVPYYDVSDAVQVIRDCSANLVTKLAVEFQIFTVVRHKSLRHAVWMEIDWKNGIWVIPGEHMKMGKEHRVALNAGALAVLKQAFKLRSIAGWDSDLIFPSHQKGKVIDGAALSELCLKLELAGTPHGFRGSFATWCAEKGVPQELAEAALAHTPAMILRAYTHTDYLERRKRLMDAWWDYIAGVLPDDWTWREGEAAAMHEAHLESQRQLAESQKTIAKLVASNATMANSVEAMGAELAAMRAEMAILKAA